MKIVLLTLTTTSNVLKHSDQNCTSGLSAVLSTLREPTTTLTKVEVEIDTSHPLVNDGIVLFLLFFKLLEHAIPSSFIMHYWRASGFTLYRNEGMKDGRRDGDDCETRIIRRV